MLVKNLATIENVSLGHPDRQTELIADKILDKLLAIDNKAKVAIEITGTGDNIAIGGEVNLHGIEVDLNKVVNESVQEVLAFAELDEYAKRVNVINIIKEQSPDIANLVESNDGTVNAGDQGHMIGYALNSPEYNYLPEAYYLTTSILKLRDEIWHKKDTQLGKWLRGDAKTQMTWSPQTGKIHSIVVSTQHSEDADLPQLREMIKEEVLKPTLGDKWHDDIILFINYAGQFVLGGIEADSSAVGRKLAITTAMGAVGGYLKNKDFEDENSTAPLPFIAMSGGASCVDEDTEYLDADGEWVNITKYTGGKVGQWNTDTQEIEYVQPSRYINEQGEFDAYHIKSELLDMVLTDDHLVAFTDDGSDNLKTATVEQLLKLKEQDAGLDVYIPFINSMGTQAYTSLFNDETSIIEIGIYSKYCFTVPSGFLVLRRNGHVFITHNCGKDPSKVDRTGHLMARYIAKNIVASLDIEEAFVQLSYVIGYNQPTSIYIQGKGLTHKQNNSLAQQVCDQVDLSPSGIINKFKLDTPIYFETTKNGHYDDPTQAWEQLDLTFKLD